MSKYILREDALKAAQSAADGLREYAKDYHYPEANIRALGADLAKERIEGLPAADVAPVVRGRWVAGPLTKFYCGVVCNNCGYSPPTQSVKNYCPNCGADMRKNNPNIYEQSERAHAEKDWEK